MKAIRLKHSGLAVRQGQAFFFLKEKTAREGGLEWKRDL